MKAELRPSPHALLGDATVIEVWYGGALIATVTGWDGPGVRIITKHQLLADYDLREGVSVVTVQVVR